MILKEVSLKKNCIVVLYNTKNIVKSLIYLKIYVIHVIIVISVFLYYPRNPSLSLFSCCRK